jgi:hypothetical protein
VWLNHYPPDERIASQTARNRSALLYFLSAGGCPYAAIAQAQANCGPFFDDAEISRGWVINPDRTDTAPPSGRFARGNPAPTTYHGLRMQPDRTTSGRYAFITGLPAGSSPTGNDLDGRTTIRSAPIAMPQDGSTGNLTFRYTFAHGPSSAADSLKLFIEDDTGARTLVWSRLGSARTVGASWARASVPLTPWSMKTVRIVFQATDGGHASLVEIGIDDIRVERAA